MRILLENLITSLLRQTTVGTKCPDENRLQFSESELFNGGTL